MTKIQLNLEPRTTSGKKVNQLRRSGLTPANIYGKGLDSQAVQVKTNEFFAAFQKAGESHVVYLTVSGEKEERPVLISDLQYDPVTDQLLHIDFRQVNLREKVAAPIPVELVGEAPAVKDFGASLITHLDQIEVEALPADLPEKFLVDISKLTEVGSSIKVSDLAFDSSKVEVKVDPETVVVSVAEQQKEEVVEAAPAAEATPETEAAAPKAEETPAAKAE